MKIVHVNQKEKIIDLIVAQSFTDDRRALIPWSVMRRNPKASRSMTENHIFGREAPAHRRHKSSALCYDPKNAPRNALATRQRSARRVRGRVSVRGNTSRHVVDMQNRRFLSFVSINFGNISN